MVGRGRDEQENEDRRHRLSTHTTHQRFNTSQESLPSEQQTPQFVVRRPSIVVAGVTTTRACAVAAMSTFLTVNFFYPTPASNENRILTVVTDVSGRKVKRSASQSGKCRSRFCERANDAWQFQELAAPVAVSQKCSFDRRSRWSHAAQASLGGGRSSAAES